MKQIVMILLFVLSAASLSACAPRDQQGGGAPQPAPSGQQPPGAPGGSGPAGQPQS